MGGDDLRGGISLKRIWLCQAVVVNAVDGMCISVFFNRLSPELLGCHRADRSVIGGPLSNSSDSRSWCEFGDDLDLKATVGQPCDDEVTRLNISMIEISVRVFKRSLRSHGFSRSLPIEGGESSSVMDKYIAVWTI